MSMPGQINSYRVRIPQVKIGSNQVRSMIGQVRSGMDGIWSDQVMSCFAKSRQVRTGND